MSVYRKSHYPKPGRWGDLVEHLQSAEMQRVTSNPHLHAYRLYRRDTGCSAPVVQKFEHKRHEEYVKFWDDVGADSESRASIKKYWELVGRVYTDEMWELIE